MIKRGCCVQVLVASFVAGATASAILDFLIPKGVSTVCGLGVCLIVAVMLCKKHTKN